ncbi:MAG: polysaccharide biosynthesis C-terminal domain-containing protein [Polyangiaceae bacterium]
MGDEKPTTKPSGGVRAFVGDAVFVVAAQVLGKLRGLVTLPLIVKGLGAEAYGVWSLILSFSVVASNVVGLNLHHALVRFVADRKSAPVYGTLLAQTFALLAVFIGVFWLVTTPSMSLVLIGTTDVRLFRVSLVIVASLALRNLNLNLYRATNHIKMRSIVDFTVAFAELGIILALLGLGFGLFTVLVAMAIVGLSVVALTSLHGRRIVGPLEFDRQVLRDATRYCVPLLPAGLAVWVLDRADRYVISQFLDAKAVGNYSAQYALASLILFAQAPFQMALLPRLLQAWNKDRALATRYLEGGYRLYGLIATFFVAVVPFLGPPVLRVLANAQVAEGSPINMAFVSAGLALWGLAIVDQCVLHATYKTRAIGFSTALAAGVNVGACVLLVPRMGITGAALATTLAYGVSWVACWLPARRAHTFSRSAGSLGRGVIAAVPAALLVHLVGAGSLGRVAAAAIGAFAVYCALLFALGVVTAEDRARLAHLLRRRVTARSR